ncbi:hypothetical protein [Brevundimonas sp. Root1423]|uniref:hypothetical protein n=1 Tax=Brevundimonas sp. Root1423 TaxID=1736462 RepID=UPI0006FD5B2E|nr:hypothetical protein [Brevundimonas sp. Root1423]KQY96379.1 hypothetical protein ASD25_00360 [Brevundimonas sp. Root1423]
MRIRTLVVVFAVLAAAACDRPVEPADAPAANAFGYSATSDLSGFYKPVSEVRIGKWKLDHVFVGQSAEFRSWTGTNPDATYSPVMVEFSHGSSPMIETEQGEVHSLMVRIHSTRYAVSDDRIEFEGTSPDTGAVRFEGRIDQGALATARRNLGDEGVVVTGTLTVGALTVRDVKLRWWMGD